MPLGKRSYGVYFWAYDRKMGKLVTPTLRGVECDRGLAGTRDPDMVMSIVATVARSWIARCPRSDERSYNRLPGQLDGGS